MPGKLVAALFACHLLSTPASQLTQSRYLVFYVFFTPAARPPSPPQCNNPGRGDLTVESDRPALVIMSRMLGFSDSCVIVMPPLAPSATVDHGGDGEPPQRLLSWSEIFNKVLSRVRLIKGLSQG